MQVQITDRRTYLIRARNYCRRVFNKMRETEHCHPSHIVARAMLKTEQKFTDLNSFGVDGDCAENGEGHITIQYLNMGDTYDLTVVYYRGRFLVTSWGDIVESIS